MLIRSLDLKNFRNYETLSLSLDPGINLFFGDNAQGKTNILEAVYVCGTSKSHKKSKDGEMIRFQQKEAHIRMMISRGGADHRIDMHLRRGKSKGVAIDGVPIRKAAELVRLTGMVFFSPEDLNMIKNGPRERRHFLDGLISQTDPYYLHQLSNYHKIVLQRNRLLKDGSKNLDAMLDVFDEQMIRYGSDLIRAREEMLKKIDPVLEENHRNLTAGKEELHLIYEPEVSAEEFRSKLNSRREKDKRFRVSSTGPHRDDFAIRANGVDIRHYGSQGQQRSAALSLKLSEIRMIEDRTGESPVLLLDDVLSELDAHRQHDLLKSIGSVQTLLTCTGMDELTEHHFPVDRVYHVTDGRVEE